MRGLTRSLGVCSAAFLLVASARADVTGTFCSTFDGDLTVTRSEGSTWASGWGTGDRPDDSSWFHSPNDQAMLTTDATHPYIDGAEAQLPRSFTLMLYADISKVVASGDEPAVMLCVGGVTAGNTSVLLAKTGANKVAVYSEKRVVSELTIEDESLAAGYHLFILINDADNNKATLMVDNITPVYTTAALPKPTAGLQLGAPFGGTSNFSRSRYAAYMFVDELRCYASALSDVADLKSGFPATATSDDGIVVDATAVSITESSGNLAAFAAYTGSVTLKGSEANGVTLGYGREAPQLNCKLVFDGGAHTLSYGGANSRLFGPAGTDAAPTLDVKSSTTLNFAMKDLSGWSATNKSPLCVVRVREDAIVNFQTISGGGTAYFNDRLVLDDGALVDIQTENNNFRLHGGSNLSAENAQIAMLGGETETAATIQGNAIRLPNNTTTGVTVAVGAKATLTIANAITVENNVDKLGKVGDGTLILSGALASGVAIEANAGTVDLRTNRPNSLKLAEGAKVRVLPTAAEIANGSLSLTLASGSAALSAENVEVLGGTVGEISDGTVNFTLSAAKITLTDESQAWKDATLWENGIVASAGELTIDCSNLTAEATLAIPSACTFSSVTISGANAGLKILDNAAQLGTVTLSGGTLTVNTLSGFGNMVNSGTLIVDCATNQAYAGTISGSGSLTKRGEGYLLFSGSSANTYSGGTRIEEGRIGIAVKDTLGSGAITVAPVAEKFAGLWVNAANVEISKQITFDGEGTCQLYIPYDRTLSVSGTVKGAGTVELVHGDTPNRGTLKLMNASVLTFTKECTVAWKILTGMNLQWGNSGNMTVAVTTARTIGKSVTVEQGGQLTFHPGGEKDQDASLDGKYVFDTPITLNGGTVKTEDGSYVISALNITAASRVEANYDKAIVFKKFYGAGDLTVHSNNTGYGGVFFAFYYPNESGNMTSSEYTGTLTFTSDADASGGYPVMQVVPDNETVFSKVKLNFAGSKGVNLVMNGNRTIGALSGSNALAKIVSSNNTERTLTIGATATESFAGTIADTVNLSLAEHVVQSLSGTLGTVADNAATYSRGITLNAGSELKLTSSTPHTFTGAISGTGTFTFSPAVTLTAASSTINAKLAGTGALTIGDGTNASAVTLTAANTYAGGTTIKAGANLVLNGTADETAVLKENKTVSVEQDGTLTLTRGISYITVAGDGEMVVDGTFTFGLSNSFTNTVSAPVTVNTGATLQLRAWREYALSVPTLIVNGMLKDEGYNDSSIKVPTLTIPATGTLAGTGSGSIELATTFESGATLDASAGALTVTKDVTIADRATVAVTLPANPAAGTEVLKCSNPAEVAAKFTGAPDGLFFAKKEAENIVVLVAPTVDLGEGVSGELSSEAQAALAKVAADNRMKTSTVSGKTTVNGEEKTLTAAQIDNALAVFGNSVVTADIDNKTLKVDYNFGIVSVTPYIYNKAITSFIVTVKAERVGGATTTAMDLATGYELKLVDSADVVINGIGDFSYSADTGLHTGYFTSDTKSADCLIGRSFKVRAQPVPATTE